MPAKPVYALIADEPYLQLQEMQRILSLLPADSDRVDIDGERAALGDVLDELRSFAMFGGGKVVVVRSADKFIADFRTQLEDYLAEPSTSSTLILRCNSLPSNQKVYKLIAKNGQIVQCEPPKERDLPAWIIRHAKSAHKLTIAPDAASMLAELIGLDLGRIDSELAKLALMCDDGKVAPETIAAGVAFQREQGMWKLTDAVSTGDIPASIRCWRQLLQMDSSSEFRAVTWLTLWLQKLARVKSMSAKRVPAFTIARDLKIWPATQVDGMIRAIQRLGDRGINDALDRLAKADLRSKSGLGEAATNVEAFLLSLAK